MTESLGPDVNATLHSRDGKGVARLTSRYKTDIDDLWAAITDPERLARWYANVEGDLRLGGEITATVHGSGWDGRGRIDVCDPPRKLVVTMWELEGDEGVVTAELVADGSHTILVIERSGMPLDRAWAYGAGWQTHLEDLALHLADQDRSEWPSDSWPRWEELAPSYREMQVTPLER
jgi:uncharacterized protein YndB with AHSA1/START domain